MIITTIMVLTAIMVIPAISFFAGRRPVPKLLMNAADLKSNKMKAFS